MGGMFGTPMTLEEQLRANKRMIDRSVREIDREIGKLEQNQKRLGAEIKKMAQKNQMSSVKVMAKDLVRTKNHINKMFGMRSQLQALSLRLQTMRSTEAMSTAMRNATRAMAAMNKQVNSVQLQHVIQEFMKESEKIDLTEEMMNDAMDDVFEDDEEEENLLVGQVLDELGINLSDSMAEAPSGVRNTETAPVATTRTALAETATSVPAPRATGNITEHTEGNDSATTLNDLEARLANLKR